MKVKLVCVLLILGSLNAIGQKKIWSLKACIDSAFKNNVVLNQQKITSEISGVNYHQAKYNQLPTLNFSDAQSFNSGNTYYASSNQLIHQNYNANSPVLSSSIVLFSGFKLQNLIKENKLNYDASLLDIETQKNNLALNITAAYVQILFQREAIAIAAHLISADSEHLKMTARYIAVGQSPEDSIYQIRAQLTTDQSAMVAMQNQLQLDNLQLEQLMERPLSPDFDIDHPDVDQMPQPTATTASEVYLAAQGTFPDIKSASLKTSAATTDISVNRAALYPVVSLGGSLGTEYSSILKRNTYETVYQTETIGYLQNNPGQAVLGTVPVTTTYAGRYPLFNQFADNFNQVIALNVTVPIFNSYKYRNNVRLSKLALDYARLNEQSVKNTLRRNVEQACTDQNSAYNTFIATREQLNAATVSYDNMKTKLRIGLVNVTTFLIEENNYYKAVLAHLQAKYEYIFKTKVVNFYLGTPLTQ